MADEHTHGQSGGQSDNASAGGGVPPGVSGSGGAAEWEDALGALVESGSSSGGGAGMSGGGGAGMSGGGGAGMSGGGGGASEPAKTEGQPVRNKKRRRRKKKAVLGASDISTVAPSAAVSESVAPVSGPAGTGGAHPTWEEAMKTMAEDYQAAPSQAKVAEVGAPPPPPSFVEPRPYVSEPAVSEPAAPESTFDDNAYESVDPWDEPVIAPAEPEPEPEPEPASKPKPESEPEAPIESEVVNDEDEDFESMLEDEDGGVTKKHLFIGIGCVAVLIIAGVVGFFLVRGFFSDKEPVPPKTTVTEPVPVQPVPEQPESPEPEFTKPDSGSAVALPAPFLVPGPSPSFIAAVQIGRTVTPEGRFISYVDTLHRMRAMYEADILQLLDQALDRRAALDAYLASLESILRETRTVFDHVSLEQSALSVQFDTVTQQKDVEELAFFAAIEALDGVAADKHLFRFNELIRRQVTVRARHRALSNIRAFLERSFPKIEARIRDIKSNMEPLVKGIKVVDIEQSDLGLIITE